MRVPDIAVQVGVVVDAVTLLEVEVGRHPTVRGAVASP